MSGTANARRMQQSAQRVPLQAVSRRTRTVLLVAILLAVAWITLSVVTAVADGDGEGGVFWAAIGLLVVLVVGLTWAARRVAGSRSNR